jgi:hypothetical protein
MLREWIGNGRLGKPRGFFSTHPSVEYRGIFPVLTLKSEENFTPQYLLVDPAIQDEAEGWRPTVLATVVDRNLKPQIIPLMMPREDLGESDNDAWESLRIVVRDGIGSWVKAVWRSGSYVARKADDGFAPIPTLEALKKLEPYPKLIASVFGSRGILRDLNHRAYRAHFGMAPVVDEEAGRDPLC